MLERVEVRGMVLFVFNFAIPLLLFRSLVTIQPTDGIEWSFLLSFFGGSLVCYFLGMAIGCLLFHRTLDHQAIFGMSAGYSNAVLVGVPVGTVSFSV